MEELEAEVESLRARVKELEHLREDSNEAPGQEHAHMAQMTAAQSTPASLTSSSAMPPSQSPLGSFAEDLSAVPKDVIGSQRYVGDSSGLLFGNIVQSVLLQAGYDRDLVPATRPFQALPTELQGAAVDSEFTFPSADLANRLQNAYFTCRWPGLPFIHRPSFLQQHLEPTMSSNYQSNDSSLFLTFMIFALGAIDIRRQNPDFGNAHIQYFRYASKKYLHSIIKEDSIQTIQGLLLIAQFAIHEHQSVNAWHAAGQAVRTAVDLGLHRRQVISPKKDLMTVEMRKRVFWATYALDRNVSITLGRPCAIRDEDIDLPLPQNLTDEMLLAGTLPMNTTLNTPLDVSTFIHIIKLRRIQSRIQTLFYSVDTTELHSRGVDSYQSQINAQLDEWIAQAPRYQRPTMATFQSIDWFQIAYSHALLLLYRPSPANPVINSMALQICADSAISLISSYSSLYAKNKITYTWIALHSLFMASITMLYTLCVSQDIRASTTKAVVRSNIVSCLALFEVMSEYWSRATSCHSIIQRIGWYIITLFEKPGAPEDTRMTAQSDSLDAHIATEQHFGQIDAEFMEWFGTRNSYAPVSFPETSAADANSNAHADCMSTDQFSELGHSFADGVDINLENIDEIFPDEFDTSIPMMINAFGSGSHLEMVAPRPSEASGATMNDLLDRI